MERFQKLAGEAGMLEEMVIEVVPGMAHARHAAGHAHMLDTIAERKALGSKQ